MKILSVRILVVSLLFVAVACVDALAQAPASPTEQVLLERIKTMETQVAVLKAELDSLRARLEAGEKQGTKAEESGNEPRKTRPGIDPAPAAAETATQTTGVDIGNGMHLIPYGSVYFNAFGNTSGTNNTDVPLWATAAEQSNSGMSLRQTRFGVRLEGGKAGNASLSGVVEADFYGGLPAVGVGENFGVVRLRVAKFKLSWERTSLSVGQDWVVFAPLNPTSIAAAAIPQFAASGNLWARLPQARIETRFGNGRFLYQGAVLAPTSGDFPSGSDSPFLLQPGAASRSAVPSFESRLAFTTRNFLGSGKAGTIAVSGHFGRAEVAGSSIRSDAVALDWNVPLARRVSISGEAFIGESLGGLQGGVFQGYNPDYGQASDGLTGGSAVRGIRSRGGWTQVSFTPPVLRDRLTFYGSAGIDDPDNGDLQSVTPRNWRSRNFSYAFNAIFKPIPPLSIGFEFRRFHTTYLITGERTAEHFNLGAAYTF